MENLLNQLNEEQLKPVLDTEGAVLVLAGAGSGKTRVLTSRIAYIIEKGLADLSSVLAITFTNKAAAEMKERLNSMLGGGESKWICTIHSMCVKILRSFGDRIGIKDNFSIYSEVERNSVIKKAYLELGIEDEKLLKNAKYHIGNAKMRGLDPEDYGREYSRERGMDNIVVIYEKYNKHLKSNNALDFDDLLLETLRLLQSDSQTLEYLSDKFKYVLVDEFQDTNSVQYRIIKLLASKHGNLFAVGDDDQSIYGWRGAEIGNILRFDKDFKDAKIYKLERNYRSTGNILKFANCIIKNNSERRGKTLWTNAGEGEKPTYFQADEEAGEALYASRLILNAVAKGAKYSDFAILMRINALTRSYEQDFTKYSIPYKVFGGFRFFERKEIKDIIAYMRLCANPFDSEAAERIINVPKRGIGGKTVEVMYEYASSNGLSLYDACVDSKYLELTKGAKEKVSDFANLINELIKAAVKMPVNEIVREIIAKADLKSAYDDGTDEGDGKLANLNEFIASCDDFVKLNPQATLTDFLNDITLSSDTDDMDGSNYVTIATIHAVKGLEFPCVIIAGLEDDIFPSQRALEEGAIEEERRLMYVAITRARERLHITRSKSRYLYGHRNLTRASRFVSELAPVLGTVATQDYSRFSSYEERRSSLYSSSDGYESDLPPEPAAQFKPSFATNKPASMSGAKEYKIGMRVRHAKFGTGMVVAVKNGGNVINVAFDGKGIKELSAQIAPLEIL